MSNERNTPPTDDPGNSPSSKSVPSPSSPRRSVHFTSRSDRWATPIEFFRQLDREFGFTLDVCALSDNAKCERFFSPDDDGLGQQWTGTCWMNPPYGRVISLWMQKAYESALAGATVVCLVPARTDTRWWQDYATKAAEIRFVTGRLKFGDAVNSAPFPSAVVVFRPLTAKRPRTTRRLRVSVTQLTLFQESATPDA
ncbi:MAG: adenine methyltransferase [Phycisphaerae bacterium]|nr:adenine methyltransferase [Phycisphaerae bacterium]